MQHDYMDITIVLDRSGSMAAIADDTRGGFNQFVAEQRAVPGKCLLTLVRFDHEFETVFASKPIAEVPTLDGSNYQPRGYTALLDAQGRAIVEAGERLSQLADSERPAKVLFVTITDGQENSSREYNAERLREMIRHQQEAYKWEFVYLGANQDSFDVAGRMGYQSHAVADFAPTSGGIGQVFRQSSKKAAAMRTAMSAGLQPMSYSYDTADRAEQEAELKAHAQSKDA